MAVTLPAPILYSALTQLQDTDENVILQRLYDRDEALLNALSVLQGTQADLTLQFARFDDIEARMRSINNIINAIIAGFYLDIDQNGIVGDNYAFFKQLISDLKSNINAINTVSGGIINFLGVQEAVQPVADHLARLDRLDSLIQDKLNYIYGKWDVDPADDLIAV
jgi:nitrogen regulatory protein PII-like uncharacterized protein